MYNFHSRMGFWSACRHNSLVGVMDYVIAKKYSLSQSISMGGVYTLLPLMFVSVIWRALTSGWADCMFLPLNFGVDLWLSWANGMLGCACMSALALLLLCYCKLVVWFFGIRCSVSAVPQYLISSYFSSGKKFSDREAMALCQSLRYRLGDLY